MQCEYKASHFCDLVTQTQGPAHGCARVLHKARGTTMFLAKPRRKMTRETSERHWLLKDFFQSFPITLSQSCSGQVH